MTATISPEVLRLAVAAADAYSPSALAAAVKADPAGALERADSGLGPEARRRVGETTDKLMSMGAGVLVLGLSDAYPRALTELPAPPPILFYLGNVDLLKTSAVGMCGSRSAGPSGIDAARSCGLAVAGEQLTIVSGYAAGVDTETHLAALDSGGSTIIVLAEGITHFRTKAAFKERMDLSRVLVLSQFPPRKTWDVGAAMIRNGIIAALGRALVVIEAGETGGTLDAGMQALGIGRPVLALRYETGPTPPGNQMLIEAGARPVASAGDLKRVIAALKDPTGRAYDQLAMTLT
jgi:DNA processing protein